MKFLYNHDVTMDARGRKFRPDWDGDDNSFHFDITVKVNGCIIYDGMYSVGSGIVADWLKERKPKVYRGMFYGKRTVADIEALNDARGLTLLIGRLCRGLDIYSPNLKDVMESLFADASSIDIFTVFEDWAFDMGLDSDSLKALKTFESCRETALRLRQVFGKDYNGAEQYFIG